VLFYFNSGPETTFCLCTKKEMQGMRKLLPASPESFFVFINGIASYCLGKTKPLSSLAGTSQ